MSPNIPNSNDPSDQRSENMDLIRQQIHFHISQLGQPEQEIRARSSEALIKLGASAVPYLITALRDSDRWLIAVETLAEIGPPAIEPLIAVLDDPIIDSFASDALNRIGVLAIPHLIASLQSQNVSVRCWSVQILGWIGDHAAIAPLQISLNDPDESVRRYAHEALRQLGI